MLSGLDDGDVVLAGSFHEAVQPPHDGGLAGALLSHDETGAFAPADEPTAHLDGFLVIVGEKEVTLVRIGGVGRFFEAELA